MNDKKTKNDPKATSSPNPTSKKGEKASGELSEKDLKQISGGAEFRRNLPK